MMWIWLRRFWDNLWDWLRKFCGRWQDVFVVLAVLASVWYCAVRDEESTKFVLEMTHEITWPLVLLVLIGYHFREPISSFIDRIDFLKAPGLEVTATRKEGLDKYKGDLVSQLKTTERGEDERRLSTLLALTPAALRLLGTVVAVGDIQRLDLGRYQKAEFQAAKRELLNRDLLTKEKGRWFRPTSEGVKTFKLHVESLERQLEEDLGPVS